MKCGILLRLVGMINLILILSCPFIIQERESNFHDFVKKNPLTLGSVQTVSDQTNNVKQQPQ